MSLKDIMKDPFVWFLIIIITISISYSLRGWYNDECNVFTEILGCGYNPEKHDCYDWECGYFNPFGRASTQFKLSQINNSYFNFTGAKHCPLFSGEYCVNDQCVKNPLVLENCVDWKRKK